MSFKLDSLVERKKGWLGRRKEGYRWEEKIKQRVRDTGGRERISVMCLWL